MRRLLLVAAASAVVSGLGLAALVEPARAPAAGRAAASPKSGKQEGQLERGSRFLVSRIERHRHEAWRWQRLMGKRATRSTRSYRRSLDPEYRRWALALWRQRAERARRQAANPPRKRAWLCIHRHEGPWNDSGAPYYGGLQMDISFQRAYGADLLRRKGTADNWTPLEQMWVAERAYRSGRGFYPWPNTARSCGLL